MFSYSRLGMELYVQERKLQEKTLQGKEDFFREKMSQLCSSDSSEFIFTNDLKTMLHIVKTSDDLELVEQMLKK